MKNRLIIFFLMTMLASGLFAQEVKLTWANRFGSVDRDYASSLCRTTQGDFILAGSFTGQIEEDTNFRYLDNNLNAWIACTDTNGSFKWQKVFGSKGFDNCSGVVPMGNCVIAGGLFQDTLFFDDKSIISGAYTNAYFAAINHKGEALWIHAAGGKATISNFKFAASPNGTLCFAGQFNDSLQLGGNIQAQAGDQGLFVASLNDQQQETPLVLMKSFQRIHLADIHCNDSLVLISGSFSDTLFYNDTCFVPLGAKDAFAALFSNTGQLKWFFQAGSENDDEAFASALLANAGVALTGYFNGYALFGNRILSSTGSKDVFIARLNFDGTPAWVRSFGDIADDYGLMLTENEQQDIYLTGSFRKIVQLPDEGQSNLSITALSPFGNAFIAKYDNTGLLRACFNLPAAAEVFCTSLHARNGIITTVGNFYDTLQLQGNGEQSIELVSSGEKDMFEAQFIDICDGFAVEAPADTILCPGQSLVLPVTTNRADYLWLPDGQMNEDIEFTQAGSYVLYAINDFGCISYDTLEITDGSVPSVYAGADTVAEAGSVLTLDKATGNGATAYVWTTGGDGYFFDNTLLNATYSLSVNDISSGAFVLTLEASNTCGTATDSLTVSLPEQSDGITVYPLPTIGPVTLVCEEGMSIETVLITRQTGEVIQPTVTVNNYYYQYNFNNMIPGTYLVILTTSAGPRTKIINKI